MTDCRILQKSEMHLAEELWAICFEEDTKEFIKYYFENCAPDDSFVGVFESNTLVSMLQIKEYDKEMQGGTMTVGYIVGLCTRPEYRMRGLAKELIYKAFEILKDRGIAFTFLYPFNYNFYKKLGYAICSERQTVRIDKEQFGQVGIRGIESTEIRENEIEEYVCEMLNAYYVFFSRLSGYIIRDEEAMIKTLQMHLRSGNSGIIIAKENGLITGYALYSQTDIEISADEVVYKNIRTFAALADRLMDRGKTVKLPTPPDEKICLYMDDPLENIQIEPRIMGEMLDITKSLPLLDLTKLNTSLFIKITNIIGQNDFKIYEINEHSITISINEIPEDFQCDSSVYMQLATGYIGIDYALKSNMINVKNYERLQLFKSIFKENRIYVFEMF